MIARNGESGSLPILKTGAAPHGKCRTTPQNSLPGGYALNTAANRTQCSVNVSGQVGGTSYHCREYGSENQSVLEQVLTRLFTMQVFNELAEFHFELLLSRSRCQLCVQSKAYHYTPRPQYRLMTFVMATRTWNRQLPG
jgi:hypothetical protein